MSARQNWIKCPHCGLMQTREGDNCKKCGNNLEGMPKKTVKTGKDSENNLISLIKQRLPKPLLYLLVSFFGMLLGLFLVSIDIFDSDEKPHEEIIQKYSNKNTEQSHTIAHKQQRKRKYNTDPWTNICESQENLYCSDVGKIAYDGYSGAWLGKIIGVTYRPKGSLISTSNLSRVSPRNAFYYIIDDGSIYDGEKQKPFIRQCREIKAN